MSGLRFQTPSALLRRFSRTYAKARPKLVNWVPPSEGKLKISCDGSVSKKPFQSSGRAGAGALIRGPGGVWLRGCTERLSDCQDVYAELWAMKRGVEMREELKEEFCPIKYPTTLETDCERAFHLIGNRNITSSDPNQQDLAVYIKAKIKELNITNALILREANWSADNLACFARAEDLKRYVKYRIAPDWMKFIVSFDAAMGQTRRGGPKPTIYTHPQYHPVD